MKDIDERLIERYVRYRETLSPSEIATIRAWLERDASARRIAAFYEEFYAHLDDAEGSLKGDRRKSGKPRALPPTDN